MVLKSTKTTIFRLPAHFRLFADGLKKKKKDIKTDCDVADELMSFYKRFKK